jgi:hypothetical protein
MNGRMGKEGGKERRGYVPCGKGGRRRGVLIILLAVESVVQGSHRKGILSDLFVLM